MTKSNFEKLAKQPMLARPPRADEVPEAGYGAVRALDGRSARRTGARPPQRGGHSAPSRSASKAAIMVTGGTRGR